MILCGFNNNKHPVVGCLFWLSLGRRLGNLRSISEGLEGGGYVVLDAVGEVVAGLLVEFEAGDVLV